MYRTLIWGAVVTLIIGGATQGDVVTISGPSQVWDAALRSDNPDANLGQNGDDKVTRMFVDANGWGVQRHWLVKFDLSAIPAGSIINSATYGIYVRRNSGLTIQTVNGYQISRLQAGKGWVEGSAGWSDPALAGEVTWNSQAHGSILWATAGVTGAADIDLATSISWNLPGGNADPGWITFDLTSMVQDWFDGTWENNGLVHWGGTYENPVGDNQRYNWTYASEGQADRVPYLIVDYSVQGCSTGTTPVDPQSVTGLPVSFATVDLGSPDVADGLTHVSEGDGHTAPATAAGRICRTNVVPADVGSPCNPCRDGYMYFAVDDGLVFQGSLPAVTISFDYFDEGTGSFDLHYDGDLSQWSSGPTVALTGTNTWNRGSFTVTDAYFGNRQNYGADFRIAGPAGHFYLDNVSIELPGNHGPQITYTIANNGTVATTWTAIEANADGTANDYAWLSLTPDPAAGPLPVGDRVSVTAVVDTTSLGHGPQTGYVKFTDGCAAPTAYNEPFTYTDGALAGQGGWTGTGDTAPVLVEANQVRLNGSGDSTSAHTASHVVEGGFEGVFSVKVNVKTGGALPGREENNFWAFRALDANGNQFGYWQGTPTTVRARNPLDANQAIPPSSDPHGRAFTSTYTTLEMRINAGTKTTEYYLGAELLGSFPFNTTSGLATISFERIQGADSSATEYVYFDDAQVSSVQQYRIRQINLDVIGCNYAVEPRTTTVSGYGGTAQQSFAIINTGAYNITGLTVTEIDRNSPYGNLDYDWLGLTVPSPINLAPGESAEVVATVNLDLVDLGEPPASLKFVATFATACAGVSGEDKLIDALTPVKLASLLYTYEMDVSVDDAAKLPAGTPPMTIIGTGYGDDPVADPGFGKTIPGDDCLRYARFVDTTSMSGEHGFYLRDLGTPAGVSGFTVDMRVWGEETTTGTDARRSASIANNLNQGRRVRIESTSPESTDDSLQITFVSSGVVAGPFTIPDNPDNATRFHTIRFVVYNDTTRVDVYDLENDLDPGPGVNWNLVGTCTNLGGTHDVPAGTAGGICLNSNSGSETTNSKWSADWVRIVPNLALAPTDDIIGGPGETCGLFADVDEDGDVDQADFAAFQVCYTGDGGSTPVTIAAGCERFNRDGNEGGTMPNGDIDGFDRTAFENCASGPGVPFDPCCNGGPGCE
jgi:hypothetical protein